MPSLAAEIHKRTPFDLPEAEAYLNLLRTCSTFSTEFDRLFKARGLSEATYNVLRILRGAGGEGLPCLEISQRLVNRLPDITRLVDRLEKAGLVRRCRIPRDRRVVMVKIAEKGLKILAELDQPVARLHTRQLGHLTRDELAQLSRLLAQARDAEHD